MYTTGEAYYTGPVASTRQPNALTPEEMDRLMKNGPQFSLKLNETDYLRAICTHRTKDGLHDTLITDKATGLFKCTVCGYVFDIIDPSTCKEDILEAVRTIQNYMQTIKVLYIDMPPEAVREYMQMIALLDKLPGLFEIAANNYLKHENSLAGWNFNNRNAGAAQLFNMLNNGMGGAFPQAGMINNTPIYDAYGRPMVMGTNGEYVPANANVPGMMPGMAPPMYEAKTTGYMYDPMAAARPMPGPAVTDDANKTIAVTMAEQGYTPEQISAVVKKDIGTVNEWIGSRVKPAAAPEAATTTTSFKA